MHTILNGGEHRAPSTEHWGFVLIALLFFAVCDTGMLGEYGGLLPALFSVMLFPRYAVGLLLLMASVQDARGLSFNAAYIGFASLAFFVVLHSLLWLWVSKGRVSSPGFRDYTYATILAVLVLITGGLVGNLMDVTNVLPAGRSVTLVSGLSVLMVVAAWSAVFQQFAPDGNRRILNTAVWLAGLHVILVVVWQVMSGPAVSHSAFGRAQVMQAGQLSGLQDFTRYTGSFLSPNAFGLFLFNIVLLYLLTSRYRPRLVLPLGIGLMVALLSLSKSLLMLFLIMILTWMGPLRAAITLLFGGAFLGVVSAYLNFGWVTAAFRLSGAFETSYRWRAWNTALGDLPWHVWLTGAGPGFWRAFYERTINISLADPHNFVLSAAGSFGILGLLVYGILAYLLIRTCLTRKVQPRIRMAAATLLALILVRDLFAVQYVLNNSPFTFLLWFMMGYLLVSAGTERLSVAIAYDSRSGGENSCTGITQVG